MSPYRTICLIALWLATVATCASSEPEAHGPPATNGSQTGMALKIQTSETQKLASSASSKPDGDRWSMVASMRDSIRQQESPAGPQPGGHRTRLPARRNAKLDWNVNLDPEGLYQLNWRVNYRSNRISFALEIDTNRSGFAIGSDIFALGFSERGELHSSDFCLIWFDLSHRVHLQDAWTSPDNVLHLVPSARSVCKLAKGHHRSAVNQEEHYRKRENADPPDWDGLEGDSGLDETGTPNLSEIDEREAQARRQAESNFEILFKRPLEVCGQRGRYYAIDNGTTHLVWFALRGPVLALDGLDLTGFIQHAELLGGGRATNGQHASPDHARLEDKSKFHEASRPNFLFGLRRAQLIANKPQAGSLRVDLAADNSELGPEAEGGLGKLDIRMDKYEVPGQETTYWCKLFKLPERFELRKFHITSYEAAIEPGMEHVVHHMELFNCANLSPTGREQLDHLYSSQGGWSGECASGSRPQATDSCRRVILAWAMGAKPLVYPEQVGQSIGGPHYSPYVVLEVHYNNVGRATGLLDSSGLRFHYTAQLRPFDAGILEVGLEYTDKNSIPPKMVTPLAGHCVGECTRVAMSQGASDAGDEFSNHNRRQHNRRRNNHRNHHHTGDERQPESQGQDYSRAQIGDPSGQTIGRGEGIYIFAAQMHTHLTGVASWTEHVREGRLLGELQRDDHYSPHFQEIRLLPEHVHVAPGDALIHYCLYDTRKRENITLGGFATADEMCVTYLHYYPRIDLEVCKSSVDTRALEDYFAQLAQDEGQTHLGGVPERLDSKEDDEASAGSQMHTGQSQGNGTLKTVSENYRSIDWSSARRGRELIEFYHKAPLSVQCNRSDGTRWPGFWNGHQPTRFIREPQLSKQAAGANQREPTVDSFELYKQASARELVAYRGLGHAKRHAQCQRAPADDAAPA